MDYLFLPYVFRIGGDIRRSGRLCQIVNRFRIRTPIQRAVVIDLSPRLLGQEMEPDGNEHPPTHGVPAHTGSHDQNLGTGRGHPDGGHEHVRGVGINARADILLPGPPGAHVRSDVVLPSTRGLPVR